MSSLARAGSRRPRQEFYCIYVQQQKRPLARPCNRGGNKVTLSTLLEISCSEHDDYFLLESAEFTGKKKRLNP